MTNLFVTDISPVEINNAGAVGSPSLQQAFTDQRYPLFSRQLGNNGNTYMYVYASASVAVNLAVQVQETGKVVTLGGAAYANAGLGPKMVGFTDQTALQAGTYGWIAISGLVSCKFKKGTHKNKAIFVSLTAGYLTTTSSLPASARTAKAAPEIMGPVIIVAPSGIGVGGTASSSGDVRPVLIVNGNSWLDHNILTGLNT